MDIIEKWVKGMEIMVHPLYRGGRLGKKTCCSQWEAPVGGEPLSWWKQLSNSGAGQ